VIIDWERARPDAPAGLDAVYAEACRVVTARRCTFGEAVALLARSATRELAATVVGGNESWGQLNLMPILAELRRMLRD
jgi:hypothetical protein